MKGILHDNMIAAALRNAKHLRQNFLRFEAVSEISLDYFDNKASIKRITAMLRSFLALRLSPSRITLWPPFVVK